MLPKEIPMPAVVPPLIDSHLMALIRMAVAEDLGPARIDQTVRLAIPQTLPAVGTIVARRAGTLSGLFLLPAILREYDAALTFEALATDATRIKAAQPLARITGPAASLLTAERTLLNFLGHLSGVATTTARYVDAIADIRPTPAVTDTRKTTPGWRALDKYAVRCGGGINDRIGLYDGVMLKDNHLLALRQRLNERGASLAQIVAQARRELDPGIRLWLEVDTIEQLAEALPGAGNGHGGADIILLDNFTPHQLRVAVELRDSAKAAVLFEASGGVTLENLRDVAQTGVDRIAIGALTHSAPVLDVSMEFA
jgi:nicotinate-nucleotide pyrophosphorylase (carboxylating)